MRTFVTGSLRQIFSLACALLLAGCAAWFPPNTTPQRASLVDYLYPAKQPATALVPSTPQLHVPVRVGIAFTPSVNWGAATLTELDRTRLLEKVKAAFADHSANHAFISAIEIIPTTYLRAGGGFENLEQAARLFRVDVVVLLSYDQVQFNDSNRLSLLYWTIIGAYVFNGDQYDVNTLVDASVFDVASHQLLFRAPGTSQIKGSSPLVKFSEASRAARDQGFRQAVDNLIPELESQLQQFRERIKADHSVQIVNRPGYTGSSGGGGDMGWCGALLALLLLAAVVRAAYVRAAHAPGGISA